MIELIAGGARSGKSSYALKRAEEARGDHIFIATATATHDDAEMASRIARHKAERGDSWGLVEEPLDVAAAIGRCGENQIVLVDCLTLWLTNWLCANEGDHWKRQKTAFLEQLKSTQADIFLVTNEVGMGVVPMGQLSRDFVDEAGWLHQDIAAIADRVTMVTFGLPTVLKGEP